MAVISPGQGHLLSYSMTSFFLLLAIPLAFFIGIIKIDLEKYKTVIFLFKIATISQGQGHIGLSLFMQCGLPQGMRM